MSLPLCAPLALTLAISAAPAIPAAEKFDTIDQLWAGFDPRSLPLEIEVLESKDEDNVHIDTIYFTGEVFEGQKTRVFGYLGRPRQAAQQTGKPGQRSQPGAVGKLPALLHIHGGGQTANRDWPRFWARRGYVCLSFDFCGNTNLPTLGPEYRRQRYTLWSKVPADMMTVGGGTRMTPTPRWNPWYHWAMAARRGLTLLEQQKDVDATRLGIFGISVGGTLTWIVAGVDDRVRVAAPIYGCGWESYQYPIQPEPSADEEKRLWRRLIAPEAHAPRIRCPVMLFSASNDFHGKMDLAFRTLDALTTPIRSQVFTANYDTMSRRPRPARCRCGWTCI
jgi:dienelactone hydrolase